MANTQTMSISNVNRKPGKNMAKGGMVGKAMAKPKITMKKGGMKKGC
jgi:hypothetical protein